MSEKIYADINGNLWEVRYPLCAGCPELVVSGTCAHEGNGCRFPENRIKRPVNMARAFFALCEKLNKALEETCDELGSCLPVSNTTKGEPK